MRLAEILAQVVEGPLTVLRRLRDPRSVVGLSAQPPFALALCVNDGETGRPIEFNVEGGGVKLYASFTTEYKLRIIRAAERCKGPGEVGALLRRLRLPELLGRVKRARARVPGAIKGRTALRPRAKAGVAARAPIGCEDEIGHGETPAG